MLLDVVSAKLDVEILGVSLEDFVEPEIDWLEGCKLGGRLDLLVEFEELLVRIEVFHVHAAYRTPFANMGEAKARTVRRR